MNRVRKHGVGRASHEVFRSLTQQLRPVVFVVNQHNRSNPTIYTRPDPCVTTDTSNSSEHRLPHHRSCSIRENGWSGRRLRHSSFTSCSIGASYSYHHASFPQCLPKPRGGCTNRYQFRDSNESSETRRLSTSQRTTSQCS